MTFLRDHPPDRGNPPRWAVMERQALSRWNTELGWWVNQRQAANGEPGGKKDNGVEILHTWIPMLLFGNEKAMLDWKYLAVAVDVTLAPGTMTTITATWVD